MARRPSGWMKAKKWSVARQKNRNGGKLERDVETYNALLTGDKAFSKARRAVDSLLLEREFENELKEVWE